MRDAETIELIVARAKIGSILTGARIDRVRDATEKIAQPLARVCSAIEIEIDILPSSLIVESLQPMNAMLFSMSERDELISVRGENGPDRAPAPGKQRSRRGHTARMRRCGATGCSGARGRRFQHRRTAPSPSAVWWEPTYPPKVLQVG